MKEIKAYIRPNRANQVIKHLELAGAKDLTLIRLDRLMSLNYQGQVVDSASQHYITRYSAVAKLELVCRDEEAKGFVEIIQTQAHTGKRGDGRIFVSHVEEALNIRTGEIGIKAL
jgi:nitrogen regulatory protein P-II 1